MDTRHRMPPNNPNIIAEKTKYNIGIPCIANHPKQFPRKSTPFAVKIHPLTSAGDAKNYPAEKE